MHHGALCPILIKGAWAPSPTRPFKKGSLNFHFVCSFEGKATISNDGATILKLLDVVHPAAKTLVDIAKSQDAEVRKSSR